MKPVQDSPGPNTAVRGCYVHSLRATTATNALAAPRRHRQGAGMAGARQRGHHPGWMTRAIMAVFAQPLEKVKLNDPRQSRGGAY